MKYSTNTSGYEKPNKGNKRGIQSKSIRFRQNVRQYPVVVLFRYFSTSHNNLDPLAMGTYAVQIFMTLYLPCHVAYISIVRTKTDI